MTDFPRTYPALQAFLQTLPPSDVPPEIFFVSEDVVACDGGDGAVGHPRVYLTIDNKTGFVVCGYCGRIYVRDAVHAAH
jgi:uncharacterized Zn-finger protein